MSGHENKLRVGQGEFRFGGKGSVMIAKLNNHYGIILDLVYDAMFIVDSAGPIS